MVYLALTIGMLMSSSAAVLIRLCNAPALVVAAHRLGIAALIVLPIAIYKHRTQLTSGTSRDRTALLFSGIFLGFHFAFWISSLDHTSVASSVLLVNTIPIFVGLGGWLILKDPLGPRLAVGTAVSLIGSALVALGDWGIGEHALIGDLLALAGAVTVSGHLLIGRRQRQRLDLIPYIAIANSVAALVLIGLALLSGHSLFGYDNQTYLLFFLLALGPQLLGHTSFNYALKQVSPSLIALVLLSEPLGSATLAYLALGESPGLAFFWGAPVILTGILLATWPQKTASG